MFKKILFTILLTVVSSTCFASPSIYRNPVYNLANVSHIKLADISIDDNGYNDVNVIDQVLSGLYSASNKEKVLLEDAREQEVNFTYDKSLVTRNPREVVLTVEIKRASITPIVTPGYYTTRTEYTHRRVWNHRHRHYEYISVPIECQVWVPETTYLQNNIDFVYKVYDKHTGEIIFRDQDVRSRDTNDNSGMINRSTNEFMKQLKKRVK